MASIHARLEQLGLELPEPMRAPVGVSFRFVPVRIEGGLAWVSGHGPTDGATTLTTGKVGDQLDADEAASAARLVACSILASLDHALGGLDEVAGWVRAFGMVNCAPGFNALPGVINGFSELILEIWGEAGEHARSAIGVAELPFDWPVEVEAVVALRRGG